MSVMTFLVTAGRDARRPASLLLVISLACSCSNPAFDSPGGNGDARLIIEDGVVIETQSMEGNGAWGAGLQLLGDAQVSVFRTLFGHNRDCGIFAYGAGAELLLEDVAVLEAIGIEADGSAFSGLSVSDGAQATLTRVLLEGNRFAGMDVRDDQTRITVTDLIVRGTLGSEGTGIDDPEVAFGWGVAISTGARGAVTRALIAENRATGVDVRGEGSDVFFSDLTG